MLGKRVRVTKSAYGPRLLDKVGTVVGEQQTDHGICYDVRFALSKCNPFTEPFTYSFFEDEVKTVRRKNKKSCSGSQPALVE